jgi:hypothetical protein
VIIILLALALIKKIRSFIFEKLKDIAQAFLYNGLIRAVTYSYIKYLILLTA